MSFFKVKVRQQADGKPGFIEDDEFEVNINSTQVTLYNKSEEEENTIFVRLTCGATLCVSTPYATFVKKLNTALKAGK